MRQPWVVPPSFTNSHVASRNCQEIPYAYFISLVTGKIQGTEPGRVAVS